MDILKIADMPTTIGNVHESCYRSYSILEKTIELLEAGTPGAVVLQIVRELQHAPRLPIPAPYDDMTLGKDGAYHAASTRGG